MQSQPVNPRFSLQEAQRYYDDLLAKLPHAKERIVLAAMFVVWDEVTDPIFREIEKALDRGVRVHILLDNYTRLGLMSNVGFLRTTWRVRFKKTLLELDQLQKKGARISYVGTIGINPFKGRCHVKITVVDNHSYSFGGINFSNEHLSNSDYMLYAHDADVADCLEQLVGHIAQAPTFLPDAEVAFGENATILFDGGEPRHSIIYSRAIELARESKRAFYVSQYAPSGALAQALGHIDTTYYFNSPEQMNVPARWGQAFDQQRYRVPNSYQLRKYIHAKFILFELKNGKYALVSGSNNFSYRGVAFGTKEIALYSTDKKLWQEFHSFIQRHLQSK